MIPSIPAAYPNGLFSVQLCAASKKNSITTVKNTNTRAHGAFFRVPINMHVEKIPQMNKYHPIDYGSEAAP